MRCFMGHFNIFVHRGGDFSRKKIPPNSLRAFEESYAIGANGIETDICFSKDGEPIICHFPSCLNPAPSEMKWKEIRKYYNFIPHFNDLIEYLIRRPSLECLLDLKLNSDKLVEIICDNLESMDVRKRIFLTASKTSITVADLYSNAKLLAYAKKISRQKIKTHIIEIWPTHMLQTIERFHPDMISFGWLNDFWLSKLFFNLVFRTKIVSPLVVLSKEVSKIQDTGTLILGGIANKPQDIIFLANSGVDGIITDYPALAVEIRESKTPN